MSYPAPNSSFDAEALIESWGLQVADNFSLGKSQLGRGNYLRQSHEIMLTAVQGDDNRFDDRSRGRHSEILDAIRELLERASPGPRLELFVRQIW